MFRGVGRGVAAGAVTEHHRAKWPGASGLEEDALQIERHTLQRASVRPGRALTRFGIALKRERAARRRGRWRRRRRWLRLAAAGNR